MEFAQRAIGGSSFVLSLHSNRERNIGRHRMLILLHESEKEHSNRKRNVDDTGATLRHNKLESVNNKQVYTIIYVLYNTNVDSEQAERK